MNFEELLALWNDESTRSSMTAEQLHALDEGLQARADELTEGDDPVGDEVLAELGEIADTVQAVRAAETALAEQAEERSTAAADLLSQIRGGDAETDETDSESDDESDPSTDSEESTDATDETEGSDGDGEPAADETESAETEASDGEREPVAASSEQRPARPYQPRVTNLRARGPQRPGRNADGTPAPLSLVASANLGGDVQTGQDLSDPANLADAFVTAWTATDGWQGGRKQISVARAGGRPENVYPEERFLGRDPRLNGEKLDAVTSLSAITAAGGRCAPSQIDYDLPIIRGSEARPVRDQMQTRFGADRGGVVTLAPPTLANAQAAVNEWTHATDVTPGENTKTCITVDCPDDDESIVDAIVKCLQFGNFRSRFFGEQVQAWVDLAAIAHAREAEQKALTAIGTGSTQVTSGEVLGAARDVLAVLDRAVAALRNRHRTLRTFPFVFGFPTWLMDMIRTDVARTIPGGSIDENLALADARINTWFAARNVRPVEFLDGEAGQYFGDQGDAPLIGWPDTVVTYLYPEGSWLFLDGGMLDLGIVRDSTLNSTNDFQIFSETFEATHFYGVESYRIEMDLCPDGSVSAAVDIDPCGVGS